MNLKQASLEYVASKQSMGMRFKTEATILRAFVKQMGDAVTVAAVTSTNVNHYLTGRTAEPVTLFWHRKHEALKGFWEFAIRRGYTDRSPVPVRRAKEPVPFAPWSRLNCAQDALPLPLTSDPERASELRRRA